MTTDAKLPACMGGWCKQRDRCADHLAEDRRVVAERLCPTGQDCPEVARRADRARLAADPRFAGWVAGSPA